MGKLCIPKESGKVPPSFPAHCQSVDDYLLKVLTFTALCGPWITRKLQTYFGDNNPRCCLVSP